MVINDLLYILNIDSSFLITLKEAAFISLGTVLIAEWIIWIFLDGRLKKAFSFLRPWFVLNVLAVFFGISVFYLLTNHLYIAAFIIFLLTILLAIAQVIKFKMLGLPVFFWDYTVLREPLNYIYVLLQKKTIYFVLFLIIAASIGVFYTVSLLPSRESLFLPRLSSFVSSFVGLVLGFSLFRIPYARFFPANSFRDCAVFKTGSIPFVILSARYSKSTPAPKGYSEESIIRICEKYSAPAKEKDQLDMEQAPNVLFYGVESLMDLKHMGVKLRTESMPVFSSLGEKTGRNIFVSPTFGGQTVQPEFELLTGLSQHHLSVPNPFIHVIDDYQTFPSLPGVFRKAGYHTLGVQAVSGHEFRRKTYSPIIEFDEFVALETDYPREDWETIHYLLADNYLVDKIKYHWPKDDKPVFGLFFSNSTHASYTCWDRKPEFEVLNTNYSEKTKDTLERYATAINQADEAIAKLIEHFEHQARKTVIFFFGDHLPGLSAVFKDLGLFKDGKGFQRFHTPMRIWSNFDIPARDRIVSSNLLCALLFDLLQTEVAELPLQLRLAVELYKKVDVFSSYIRDKEGTYYNRQHPPEFLRELAREYDQVQYDLLEGTHYVMRYCK